MRACIQRGMRYYLSMTTTLQTDYIALTSDQCNAEGFHYTRRAREVLGCPNNAPIQLVPGSSAPRLEGEHGHHVTASGKVIQYPQSYRRAGGYLHYVKTTVRVVVGREWAGTGRGKVAS